LTHSPEGFQEFTGECGVGQNHDTRISLVWLSRVAHQQYIFFTLSQLVKEGCDKVIEIGDENVIIDPHEIPASAAAAVHAFEQP
jgi:hypothetical protein